MTGDGVGRFVACLAAMAWGAAASAGPAPLAPAAPAASAPAHRVPHLSPYVLAARQHAQEASAPAQKMNPLVQHRPRLPSSLRRG